MSCTQAHWPELTFFELPESVRQPAGIGWSRYWIQCLAELIVPQQQKYCFVLDDSVRLWRGATAHRDCMPCHSFACRVS